MEKIELIKAIVTIALTFVTSILIPFVVKLKKDLKKAKTAESDEQFSSAVCAIKDDILDFVNVSEITFKSYCNEQKAKGSTSGSSTKLNYVLDKIETDCIKKGIGYDKDYWTTYINNLIETTKTVN